MAWGRRQGAPPVRVAATSAAVPGRGLYGTIAPMARVRRTKDQSLPNNQWTALSWQAADINDGFLWDPRDPTLLVCRLAPGRYGLEISLQYAASATGDRGCEVDWAPADTPLRLAQPLISKTVRAAASGSTVVDGSVTWPLRGGDRLLASGFQNSGGPLALQAFGNYTPVLTLTWVDRLSA